jgi:hypothetical protein
VCRSIKTLRPPYTAEADPDQVRAAALQYVRKVAGMRTPSAANETVFAAAVARVAEATGDLLQGLKLRPVGRAGRPAVEPRR